MTIDDSETSVDRRLASGWTVEEGGGALRHRGGFSSRPEFLRSEGGQLFTVFHEPVGTPSMGVVVCPPVLAEAVRNQRRELALGWELSAAGMAVARMHYRGSGHSSGDPTELSFDTMVHDARTAGEALRQRTGVGAIAYVGTRIGAYVASEAAEPASPVVLWEPPVDMRRYYNLVFRARIIGLFKRGDGGMATESAMMDELHREGSVDVTGNPLARSLYDSTIDLDLAKRLSEAGPRPTLVVQMSVKPELRPGLVETVERCADAGIAVETAVVTHDEAWWFGARGKTVIETNSDAFEAIPLTVAFLRRGLA